MNSFYLLVILHFVGDFMLQGDRVALNKRGVNAEMIQHGIICATLFALPLYRSPAINLIYGTLFIFFTHVVIDAIRVEIGKKYKLNPNSHNFWALLGIDQILHITCLFLALLIFF